MMLSIFFMSYLPSMYLLWLSVCSNLLCIYLFSCCFLIIESRAFFIYSIYMSLIRYIVCKFFLLVCSLSFHSLNSVSWRGEFWWSLIYQDFLLWIMLFMLCLKRLCFNSRLKNFLCFLLEFLVLDFLLYFGLRVWE